MSLARPITMVSQYRQIFLVQHSISQGHIFTWGQNWVSHYKWINISSSKIQFTGHYTVQCCRYCPMHSIYVIEQRLYMDVKYSVPGQFYLCGCRCSAIIFKYYVTEHILHMDVKCSVQAILLLRVEILWCSQIMEQNRAAHWRKMWCISSKRQLSDEDDWWRTSPVYPVARDSDKKTSFMQESNINPSYFMGGISCILRNNRYQ
jgi:hypothetical protein